jgi:hypothetical protein
MTTNPFYNALFAITYIIVLVTGANFFATNMEGVIQETILLPMGVLGVLVFSVALMAYVFFYQPAMMFFDGKREAGIKLFLQTVAVFGVATAAVIITALAVGYSLN